MDAIKISSGVVLPLVCVLVGITSIARACDYASIDPRHTMCIFEPKQCSGKRVITSGGLSCEDKDDILLAHNRLRQKLALGAVRGQPAALNMQTLVWDEELATVAQRWADQCRPGHDRSRNVGRFTVGQNVAAVWTYERDEGDSPDFETQIEAWFNEVLQHGFSESSIEPFKYKKPTGHYTQMAWAETYLVGCGYTYYEDPTTGYTKLYVCNYAPGGNVVGGSMYKVGYPGQQYCVNYGLTPNDDMQGLCQQEDLEYDSQCMDSYIHPSSQKSNPSNSGLPRHHIMSMMTPPPPPISTYSHHNQQPPPPPPPPSNGHHHFTIPSFPPRQPGGYHKGRPLKGLNKIMAPWKLINHFGG